MFTKTLQSTDIHPSFIEETFFFLNGVNRGTVEAHTEPSDANVCRSSAANGVFRVVARSRIPLPESRP